MANSYVTEGAQLKCSKGSEKTGLIVSKDRRTFINGKPQANVKDKVFEKRLEPFGHCSACDSACHPTLGAVWSGGKRDVVIEGGFALLQTSVLYCNKRGKIFMVNNGQPAGNFEIDRALKPVTPHIKSTSNENIKAKKSKKLYFKQIDGITILQSEGTLPVYIRNDVTDGFTKAVQEINSLGGKVVSSGGKRDLRDCGRPGTSSTSLHYLGLAVDLWVYGGMQNAKSLYIITRNGGTESKPRWNVYCETENENVEDITINAAIYCKGVGYKEQKVTGRFINVTAIFEKYGWHAISARSKWENKYMNCEWWHFQNTSGLVQNNTIFKEELLKVYEEKEINKYIQEDRQKYLAYKWKNGYFDK